MTTMKQLSIQQQKEIDQLKTTMAKEKEGDNILICIVHFIGNVYY